MVANHLFTLMKNLPGTINVHDWKYRGDLLLDLASTLAVESSAFVTLLHGSRMASSTGSVFRREVASSSFIFSFFHGMKTLACYK